ncbi:hypothetical protein [uncultured Vibrio sp.]|uniref:hypothetical protein n=1 Tax=uncultured Vibrio sp. TaxID=114054 RepID=UPI0026072BED|nr:hypothetical protein [uncultured Vibrio sp.]
MKNEKTIGIAFNDPLENIHNEFENQGLSKPFVITVPDDINPDMLSKMICTEFPKGRPIVIYSNNLCPDNNPKLTHIAPLSIQ